MGQRIIFFKNDFNKGLTKLLFDNYSMFKHWYLDCDKSSMEEFNEPFGSKELKTYFKNETDFIAEFDNLDKQLIDEVSSEFIGNYCDLTDRDGIILKCFGPTMSKRRYDQSSEMVTATKDINFIKLWTYIVKGRSLKDNKDFNSYTNSYKIGFLDRQEIEELKNKIEYYFGDIKNMKDRFWTDTEKRQLENAISNSNDTSYYILGHNPISSGLEYVMQAIEELMNNNKELIIGIE
jgi:hypothetical protein